MDLGSDMFRFKGKWTDLEYKLRDGFGRIIKKVIPEK
jgi:hypothetical protein